MYCPNCGKKISEKSEFCPYCGHKINNKVHQKPIIKSTRKNHHKSFWIILVIFIILVGGFSYHQWKQSPESVNLSKTLPGHIWKVSGGGTPPDNERLTKNYDIYKGRKISKVTYHKNSFTETQPHDRSVYTLKGIHHHSYYVLLTKCIMPSYKYYGGNTLKVNGSTITRHNDKVLIKQGSHQKTISLKKMLSSNNSGEKGIGDLLAHKPLIFTKE